MARNLPRSRRIAIRLLLVVASVAVAGAVVYAARDRVLAPLILRVARGAVAEHLHAELSLSGLEGNWITHLVVEDLTIEQHLHGMDGTRPFVDVQGGRLEARYSPWGLLTGGIDGLRDVQLSAKSVVVGPPPHPAEEPELAPDEPGSFPAHLPRIRVDIELLEVALDERRLTAEALAVDAEDDRFRLDASLTWRDPSRTVAAPAALEGRYAPERIAFDTLRLGELLDLRSASVTLPPAPLAVQAEGTLLEGSVTASLADDAWELSLGDVLLDALAPLIASDLVLTGRADLSGAGALDGSTARATLTARDLFAEAVNLEELRADVELTPDEVRVPHLTARRGENSLQGEDWTLQREPFGTFELLRHVEGRLHLEASDVPDLMATEAPGALPHRIVLDGTVGQGLLSIDAGELRTEAGLLTVSRGSLRLGDADTFAEAELALEMTADFDQLIELARLFGEEHVRGSIQGSLVLDGKLRELRGHLEGELENVVVRDRVLGDGVIVGTYDETRALTIERLELDGELGTLSVTGTYSFLRAALSDARLEASCPALGDLGVPELTAGSVRLSADLDGPLGELRGTLSIDGAGVVYAGSPADAVTVRGVFEGERTRLETLKVESALGRVSATADLVHGAEEGWTAALTSLEAVRGEGRLALAEAAELRFLDAERWSLSPLLLQSNTGTARVSAERDADGLAASLVLEDFDPLPLTAVSPYEDWRTSGLNARVDVRQEGARLGATYDVSVPSLRAGADETPWSGRALGSLADGRLRIDELAVAHAGVGTLSARGDMPLEPLGETLLGPGPLEVTSSFDVDFDKLCRRIGGLPPDLAGRFRGEIALGGEWRAVRGNVRLDGQELSLAALGQGFEAAVASLALELVADQDGWRVDAGSLTAPELGSIEATGHLAASLDVAGVVAGEELLWRESPLDLRLVLALEETSWLANYTDALRRTGGDLRGELHLTGPANAPEFEGSLALTGGALRLAGGQSTIEGLAVRLAFDRRRVTLEDLRGELGGSPFAGGGTVDFGGDEPELALQFSGENVLLVRQSGMRMRADTELEVAGKLSEITATGKVALTEGRYGLDIDFLGALRGEAAPPAAGGRGFLPVLWREGPLSRMTLDIELSSSAPFLVKNNVAAFELRPQLLLHGTGEVPLLDGSIYIDPGRVALPSGWLAIESGRVEFREDMPFAPLLELLGKTRIKGYDIGVRVSGDATRPEVELWSTPPLPGEDLLVLFLTGELPEGTTAESAAQSVAVYLAKDYISRWMRSHGREDDTLLQRVEVTVGADVTRSGAPTTEVVYYLSDRPRIEGWVPYLTANRDKYDQLNMGVGVLFRLR